MPKPYIKAAVTSQGVVVVSVARPPGCLARLWAQLKAWLVYGLLWWFGFVIGWFVGISS